MGPETEADPDRSSLSSRRHGGGYGDEGIKSAVFTELVDDETDRIISDEGVRFELYRTDWGLQNGMGAPSDPEYLLSGKDLLS